MIKFKLTLHWPKSPSLTAEKSFNTVNANRAWGFAKKWQYNCLTICGKDDKGVTCDSWELQLVK